MKIVITERLGHTKIKMKGDSCSMINSLEEALAAACADSKKDKATIKDCVDGFSARFETRLRKYLGDSDASD